jgi:hypothetical protein
MVFEGISPSPKVLKKIEASLKILRPLALHLLKRPLERGFFREKERNQNKFQSELIPHWVALIQKRGSPIR